VEKIHDLCPDKLDDSDDFGLEKEGEDLVA